MTIRELVLSRSAQIRAAAEAHGGSDVRLFGTAARGEDRPDSDIDLLVTLAPGKSLLDLARLELSLEELLQRPVDVVTLGALTEPMRSTVLNDAIDV
ncbi:MAG: nucleotidyltransferase domain-containing protein [Gemmatimonadota bacterium]